MKPIQTSAIARLQRRRAYFGRFIALFLILPLIVVALSGCAVSWSRSVQREWHDGARYAERAAATTTPVPAANGAETGTTGTTGEAGGTGGLRKPLPPATPAPVSASELATLSTEEQLAVVVAPTRDLRDLTLRLHPTIDDIPRTLGDAPPVYQVGDRQEFWVHELGQNRNFRITAELVHKTDVAYAWVEADRSYAAEPIINAVDRFSRRSYPAVVAFFGSEWNPGVDNDPRLHILHATGVGDGIAGYYSSADEYTVLAREDSNQKEIFYINLEWLNRTENYTYYETVLAHEFQHMIHWYKDRNEETWVNEGMSEFAQEVAGFEPGTGFAHTFAMTPDTQLNTWGEESGGNGAHYGAAYLMMTYFAQRFGPEAMRTLVAHPANGLLGFDAVLAGLGESLRFDDLFADWVVANYVDDPNALGREGVYGYRNFAQAPPRLDMVYERYPTELRSTTVGNYATDYIALEHGANDGPLTIHFRGETASRLAELEPYSGDYVWWSNRGDDFDTRLTREFDLSTVAAGAPVTMTAALWWDLEDHYDYGYVMASRDGESWTILSGPSSSNGVNGNAFGPGYTGESNGWHSETFDLSAFAGAPVQIRFEMVTDDAINTRGFFVDDVAIPAIGYFGDFEAGVDGWLSEGWLLTDNQLTQRWIVQLLTLDDQVLTDVMRVDVDAAGRATIQTPPLGSEDDIVLAVSGATPGTTEPAAYEFWVDRPD